DTEAIRAQVEQQGSKVVIPRKRNSLTGNAALDKGLYRNRHLVENAFARLKHFRAVASRFDKLKRSYESVIAMACAFLWLPM
ncbi:transposase, partial [Pseudomonas syringae pv. actinidifoliorum]|nr:transposase [Pseudomonas syringae pv. actinidifoliorum]